MIINAVHVLDYVDQATVLKVLDVHGNDAFPADYERILDLVAAGHVCGKVRGTKLRWLELLVPLSEAVTPKREIETAASVNARTNIGAYRQKLDAGSCWALCLNRAFEAA